MNEGATKYMTVRELAEFLHIKERKVYALASEGKIPCSRATGKLLFPRAGVEQWLARHSTGGGAVSSGGEPPMVFAGSHDPLLDWALRESRCGIPTFFDGSLDGLRRLKDGEAAAAGLHIYEGGGEGWNVGHAEQDFAAAEVVLLEWAWRERGLVLPQGNPKGLKKVKDLRGSLLVPRQPEAGSQLLLEALLEAEGLAAGDLELVDPPARSEADLVTAVAEGRADTGFGLGSIARQFRLDFVPVMRERYDVLVMRKSYFREPFQRFLEFCRSERLAAKAEQLGGYDISGFGRVHFIGG